MKYDGGDTVGLYDLNGNKVADLPATVSDFVVDAGDVTITVTQGSGDPVQLNTQFIVTGEPYVLKTNDLL